MVDSPIVKTTFTLAAIALTFWIVQQVWAFGSLIGEILRILAGAWFLTVLVRPIISGLNRGLVPGVIAKRLSPKNRALASRLHLPMGVSVAIGYLALFVFVIGIATISATSIAPQVAELIAGAPQMYAQLPGTITSIINDFGPRVGISTELIARLAQTLNVSDMAGQLQSLATLLGQQVLRIATGTASVLGQIFLALVLSLYITTEGQSIMRDVFRLLPLKTHSRTLDVLKALSGSFDGYLRGAVAAAAIEAANATFWMTVLGIPFSFALGAFYFVLALVPLIGAPVSMVTIGLVSLIFRPAMFPWMMLALILFNLVSAYVITPRLMKGAVGVPGLIGLLGTSAGVSLFGFWGLLFTVPVIGALYTLAFKFWGRRAGEGYGPPLQAAGAEKRE